MYPRIVELPFGITIYSFGLMVALAILTASWLTTLEVRRYQENGMLGPIRAPRKKQPTGKKDRKAKKGQLETVQSSEFVGTLTVIAAVMGIAGAKLFHILENLGDFFADPMGMIFSRGGLTFYGGLIVAGVSIAYYARSRGVSARLLADAIAPGLMIAYGIGRIGCHLSGDGDWGIQSYLSEKPGWIPAWLWSETYPNNILGQTLPGDGVYPTPIYELAMALLLFGILWALRKHPRQFGWLFSVYLIFNGVERFLIEQIRVNVTFPLFGRDTTQAELISAVLVLAGILGMVATWKKRVPLVPVETAPSSVRLDGPGT